MMSTQRTGVCPCTTPLCCKRGRNNWTNRNIVSYQLRFFGKHELPNKFSSFAIVTNHQMGSSGCFFLHFLLCIDLSIASNDLEEQLFKYDFCCSLILWLFSNMKKRIYLFWSKRCWNCSAFDMELSCFTYESHLLLIILKEKNAAALEKRAVFLDLKHRALHFVIMLS